MNPTSTVSGPLSQSDLEGFKQQFQNTTGERQQTTLQQSQRPKAPSTSFLSRFLNGAIAAPKYFANADIINPAKQVAAQVTGNKVAMQNAENAQGETLGKNPAEAAKKLAGNTAQLVATFAAPEAKAGIVGKVAQGAKIGAVAGGGSALANDQNILKGAAEGAVTGGAANGILSKLLGGGKAAAATQDAEKVAAAKQAGGLRNPVASGGAQAQKYGTDLLANKLNIGTKDAVKFNGPETVSRLQGEHGLTVHQAAQLQPVVTGGEGATTEALDNALENMGKVDFKDFSTQMKAHINDPEYQAANLPDGASSAQGKNLQAVIDKYHSALNPPTDTPLLKNTGDTAIDSGTNAKSAMDVAKNLEKEGYKNQTSASPNKQGLSDLQLKMADNIKSKIFNAPGGQEALEGAKDDAASELESVAQQSGNKKLASVAGAIRKTTDFPSYRNVSQPFVNAKQLVDKSDLNDFANSGADSGRGGLFSTVKKAASKVVSPVGGKILSNVGNKIESNTLENASGGQTGGILSKLTGNNPAVANGVTRAGAVGTAAAAGNPPQKQQPAGGNASTEDVTNMISSLGGDSGSTDTTANANSPFSSDNIQAAILNDIATTGGKNITALTSLYNTFGKTADTQSTTEKNTVDSLNSALATLGTYNDQLNASGGGRGVVGGNTENILGKYGLGGSSASNVRAIESQKTDVATSIAKALTGGKPSSAQIKSWENAIPNVTDTAAVAKAKIANITASIQSKLESLGANQ